MKAIYHLIENAPYFPFFEHSVSPFSLIYLCLQVAIIRILHHDAKRGSALLEKRLFVTGDVLVLERGEDAHLVDRVVLLLRCKFRQTHLRSTNNAATVKRE